MPWGAGAPRKAAEVAPITLGPSTNDLGKNCAARGDLVKSLALSGPEGGAFEGPD